MGFFMHNHGSILFIGDSLTEWFDLRHHFPDLHLVNEGIAGDTTYGLLERIDAIMSIPAAKIFLMIGINDILNGFQADDIIENLQLIMEDINTQSNRSKLIMQSILPVNESMVGGKSQFNATIRHVNTAISEYCLDCRVHYLDLHSCFLDGNELNRMLTTDGAHLSEEGYLLWAKKLRALLKKEAPA